MVINRSERFNIEEVDNINNKRSALAGRNPRCMRLVFERCGHVTVDIFGLGRRPRGWCC
jgi:hypothetical protein